MSVEDSHESQSLFRGQKVKKEAQEQKTSIRKKWRQPAQRRRTERRPEPKKRSFKVRDSYYKTLSKPFKSARH